MVNRSRGVVAPGKRQTNWRIENRWYVKLEEEAERRGFATVPALANFIFAERYHEDGAEGEHSE